MINKLKIKTLLFAAVMFAFAGCDLYAYNVNGYSDLAAAISAGAATVTFTTAAVYFAGSPAINYAGPVDIYGNGATLDGAGFFNLFSMSNTNAAFHGDMNFVNGYGAFI